MLHGRTGRVTTSDKALELATYLDDLGYFCKRGTKKK